MKTEPRQPYRLLYAHNDLKPGTILYPLRYSDYGCASDDQRRTQIDHVSMTLKADGDYPGMSIPNHYLQAVPYKPHLRQWRGVWFCSDPQGGESGPHVSDEDPSKALNTWHVRVALAYLGRPNKAPLP